jgi:hypothetical protein
MKFLEIRKQFRKICIILIDFFRETKYRYTMNVASI